MLGNCDREHANRTDGRKFETYESAKTESDRLNGADTP
jgi:hypothetical protein